MNLIISTKKAFQAPSPPKNDESRWFENNFVIEQNCDTWMQIVNKKPGHSQSSDHNQTIIASKRVQKWLKMQFQNGKCFLLVSFFSFLALQLSITSTLSNKHLSTVDKLIWQIDRFGSLLQKSQNQFNKFANQFLFTKLVRPATFLLTKFTLEFLISKNVKKWKGNMQKYDFCGLNHSHLSWDSSDLPTVIFSNQEEDKSIVKPNKRHSSFALFCLSTNGALITLGCAFLSAIVCFRVVRNNEGSFVTVQRLFKLLFNELVVLQRIQQRVQLMTDRMLSNRADSKTEDTDKVQNQSIQNDFQSLETTKWSLTTDDRPFIALLQHQFDQKLQQNQLEQQKMQLMFCKAMDSLDRILERIRYSCQQQLADDI